MTERQASIGAEPNEAPEAVRPLEASIIIPTYGRPAAIKDCLSAISAQQFQTDRFEVIVVDDGSPIPISGIVEGFAGQIQLTLLRQNNAGPAAARNAGAAIARGRLLVFTDDDCMPHPDWLSRMLACATDRPGVAIGGRTVNALQSNVFSSASQILIDYLYAYCNDPSLGGNKYWFTSNNLALPAASFLALGGFCEEFRHAAAEDRELCDRWIHEGHAMIYEPTAQIRHHHCLGIMSFLRQHFVYGRGAHQYHCLRRARGRENSLEPFSFYRDLVLYPFGRLSIGRALLVALLLCVTQVANAGGYFWQKWLGK